MGIVLLDKLTHSLLLKIKEQKNLRDKANYTNDQIVSLALHKLQIELKSPKPRRF